MSTDYSSGSNKDVQRGLDIVGKLGGSTNPKIKEIKDKLGIEPGDSLGMMLRKLVTGLNDETIDKTDAKELSKLMEKSFSVRSKLTGGGDRGRLLTVIGKVLNAEVTAEKGAKKFNDSCFTVETDLKGRVTSFGVDNEGQAQLDREVAQKAAKAEAKEAGWSEKTVESGGMSYTQWRHPEHQGLRNEIRRLGGSLELGRADSPTIPNEGMKDRIQQEITQLESQLVEVKEQAQNASDAGWVKAEGSSTFAHPRYEALLGEAKDLGLNVSKLPASSETDKLPSQSQMETTNGHIESLSSGIQSTKAAKEAGWEVSQDADGNVVFKNLEYEKLRGQVVQLGGKELRSSEMQRPPTGAEIGKVKEMNTQISSKVESQKGKLEAKGWKVTENADGRLGCVHEDFEKKRAEALFLGVPKEELPPTSSFDIMPDAGKLKEVVDSLPSLTSRVDALEGSVGAAQDSGWEMTFNEGVSRIEMHHPEMERVLNELRDLGQGIPIATTYRNSIPSSKELESFNKQLGTLRGTLSDLKAGRQAAIDAGWVTSDGVNYEHPECLETIRKAKELDPSATFDQGKLSKLPTREEIDEMNFFVSTLKEVIASRLEEIDKASTSSTNPVAEVAAEPARPSIPEGWITQLDPTSGKEFYFNQEHQQLINEMKSLDLAGTASKPITTWDPPTRRQIAQANRDITTMKGLIVSKKRREAEKSAKAASAEDTGNDKATIVAFIKENITSVKSGINTLSVDTLNSIPAFAKSLEELSKNDQLSPKCQDKIKAAIKFLRPKEEIADKIGSGFKKVVFHLHPDKVSKDAAMSSLDKGVCEEIFKQFSLIKDALS